MTELIVFLIPFIMGAVAGAIAMLFMTNARRQDARNDYAVAIGLIADIAEGSTSPNSLSHIARIARTALEFGVRQ